MTIVEIQKSPLGTVARWLHDCNACPKESGDESVCVVDDEGDIDCVGCWMMHLAGEDRENVIDDAKEYGRGYRV